MKLDLLNEFWKRTEQEKLFSTYREAVRRATPFSLDDDMAATASKMAASADDAKLLRYLQAARLPYDILWIEADYEHAFAHQAPHKHAYGHPARVGWLMERKADDTITVMRIGSVFNTSDKEVLASIYPLTQMWHPSRVLDHRSVFAAQFAREDDLDIIQINKAETMTNLDPAYLRLGWTEKPLPGSMQAPAGAGALERGEYENDLARASPLNGRSVVFLEAQVLAGLVREARLSDGLKDPRQMATQVLHTAMSDQAGDLGFLCATLALVNEVPVDFVETRPSGSLRAGGRLRPYMRTSIVSLKVPATKRRIKDFDKTIKTAVEAAKRARHKVRGHFLTADKPPRAEVLREEKRWETFFDPNHNGRLRWRTWISDCWRGTAEVGYVEQFYEVVAARRKTGRSKKPVDNELDLSYEEQDFNAEGPA